MTTFSYNDLLDSMRQRYQKESGCHPDDASDIGIRLKVLAGELFALQQQIEALGEQVFPQTSTGEFLDNHAALRGHARKEATYAIGEVTFSREQPAPTGISIPVHTLLSTQGESPITILTTKATEIPKGEQSVSAPARVIVAGSRGNLAAGQATMLISTLPGVTVVTNQQPFTGGYAEESDAGLRDRLVYSHQNISNGTNVGYYYDIAAAHAGVSQVAVLPRKRGRGTVDIALTTLPGLDSKAICYELSGILDREREVNVDVAVYPAESLGIVLTLSIANHPDYSFEDVRQKCQEHIHHYLSTLGIGKPLRFAYLGRSLLQVVGLLNYSFLTPNEDVHPLAHQTLQVTALSVQRRVA